MPASFGNGNGADRVRDRLKATLSGPGNHNSELDERLQSDSKKILLKKIDFKPAERPHSLEIDSLKTKYIPLNTSKPVMVKEYNSGDHASKTAITSVKDLEGESLPEPKQVLFKADKLKSDWHKSQGIGAGLLNLGNTCFINATLQCLTYTPPLANYCLTDDHSNSCKKAGFCLMCEIQRHIRRALLNTCGTIRPQVILQKLKLIAKHLQWGHQEDAHEFLRYVIDGCQKSLLTGLNHVDKYTKETTVVGQIFGGFLRSQVICLKCRAKSNTYDPNLDISLDIKNCGILEKALEKFVQSELLDIDNAYKCTKCRQKVKAQKRFTIHRAPNVLTIQLKRFEYGRLAGGKVTKHIHFPDKLDIRTYMSQSKGPPVPYKLYGVLVHSGGGCNMGHYYSYVKAPGDMWYIMNDSMVSSVSRERVHGAEAYLLFYTKDIKKQLAIPQGGPLQQNNKMKSLTKSPMVQSKEASSTQSRFIGPVPPSSVGSPQKSTLKLNGTTVSTPSDEMGSPVGLKGRSLPEKRERVPFGLQTPPKSKPNHSRELMKPRIVMKIKHGKVTTIETSPDGQQRLVSDDESPVKTERVNGMTKKRSSLVPYDNDSDSDRSGSSQAQKLLKLSEKGSKTMDDTVTFDERLNATTSVPGNAHLLETAAFKDRMAQQALNLMGDRKGRDMKSPPPKVGNVTPVKRSMSDQPSTISCITSPSTAKATLGLNWQVQNQEAAPSPSIGSNSSNHSNSSASWSVSKTKKPVQTNIPDRQCPGWTVTHGTTETIDTVKVRSEDSSDVVKPIKSLFEQKKSLTQLKHRVLEEQKSELLSLEISISDKLPLLTEEGDSSFHHKKKKKHKKHKKERDSSDAKYETLEGEDEESHSAKKHKKKKKKKSKDREREREEEKRVSQKRKHEDREEEEKPHKRHRESSESSSSTEFEWVEKTSRPKEESFEPRLSKSSSDVPVQAWDHHVRDSYKRSADHKSHSVARASWDGLKGSRIVQELEQMSSSHGYGSSVSAWDGGKSCVDTEAETHWPRKHHCDKDEYEEELDRGKVKKIKKHYSDTDIGNRFQTEQDRKNREKIKWDNLKVQSGKHQGFRDSVHQSSSHSTLQHGNRY